jgi:hypothetical protein
MAIDPKKMMVKVLKKVDPEKKEKEKGINDKESASENKVELTQQYTNARKNMQNAANKPMVKSGIEDKQGISINENSLSSKPKVFKRKIIKFGSEERGSTRIMSEDGKSVKYEGRNNMQSTKDALLNNSKDEKHINSTRKESSNYYNVNSGAKKDRTEADNETLIRNLKAKQVKK